MKHSFLKILSGILCAALLTTSADLPVLARQDISGNDPGDEQELTGIEETEEGDVDEELLDAFLQDVSGNDIEADEELLGAVGKVYFHYQGGKSDCVMPTTYNTADRYITYAQNPVRPGYAFSGWYKNPDCTGSYFYAFQDGSGNYRIQCDYSLAGEDLHLYANWSTIRHYVNYELDGGTNHDRNKRSYTAADTDRRLYAPTKENFYFAGWYADPDFRTKVTTLPLLTVSTYTSYVDVNLYAKWLPMSRIVSVKKAASNKLKITWSKAAGAVGYDLYGAEKEDGSYKKLCATNNATTTAYIQKVKKGVPYYYYVVTRYAGGGVSAPSGIFSGIVPKSGKAKSKRSSVDTMISSRCGQYSYGSGDYAYEWNWAHSDEVYQYVAGGKLYTVFLTDKKLKVYKVDSSGKVKKYKTISLSSLKYDHFGGFYAGKDGKFYVAVGYDNKKESKTKTVIKVVQYSSKWKKQKTASIKGGVRNAFQGIYIPFRAGNVAFDMKNDTLFMYTAREMFVHADGLHHQSNITFAINTKTMKAVDTEDVYVSHSFNQLCRFKDGHLYTVDHGDAYPRSICLNIIENYGTEDSHATAIDRTLFAFQGVTGDNYTGATVGGMEVGAENVLVCGTSVPHDHAVKGVKGADSSYKKNVYLIVSGRKSEKTKFIWITQNNPKSSGTKVGETRMVKLSDDLFAILYNERKDGKDKLVYYVVNGSGKKVKKKTYSGVTFDANSQPVIANGKICWSTTTTGKLVTNSIPIIY